MASEAFPEDFKQRMMAQLGSQFAEFAAAHKQQSPVSIRINASKHTVSGLEPVPWTSTGFYLAERPSFTLDPSFHGGAYYVQEASSMFLEQAFLQAIDPAEPINVLDLCGAPGGKSTHLLSLMNKESLLVSNEVIRSRSGVLAENIQKWGSNNVVVTSTDPEAFNQLAGFFDLVVIDAPCSGEGMFRKDPAAMDTWSLDNVALCTRRQQRILSDVWPAIKAGGHLIYSTCTYNASENEENLAWLESQHDIDFIPLNIDPNWNIESIQYGKVIGYKLYPHRVKGEGLFLAVIRKASSEKELRLKSFATLATPSKKIQQQLAPWISDAGEKTIFQHADQLRFFPTNKMRELEVLAKSIYIVNAGTHIATAKHDKLVPAHAGALSQSLNKENFESIRVTQAEALTYLRKQTMNPTGNAKGFALVEYNELPLGWVNVLDNRINNLYPADWKIRM